MRKANQTIHAGPVAKYYQVSEIIRNEIAAGVLVPDEQISPEDQLCARFGVSRGTLRKAVRLLEGEGLLRREQGRGTFINPPRTRLSSFSLMDFDQSMRQQERRPSTKTLSAELVPATAEVAERLGIASGEPVIHIAQLRFADNVPMIFEERYLAQSLCPQLLEDDLETESIHWLLVHKYQLPLIWVMHMVELRDLDANHAVYFGGEALRGVFYVDRLTYTRYGSGERPAVWYRAFYRGDDFHFVAEFHAAL